MKESESKIIDEIAKKGDGLIVPENYFQDFAKKMSGSLPFREELEVPLAKQKSQPNKNWLRVRPYVYMAAMFAGAWCLIKMFTLMSPTENEVKIENYPALSHALEDKEFIDEFIIDDFSSYDVYESYCERNGIEDDSQYFDAEMNDASEEIATQNNAE